MAKMRLYTITLLLFMTAISAEAQSVTVSGRVVHDQTGSPQARIPLYLMGTPKAAFSDSVGRYFFRQVAPGSYELVAVVPGHGQITQILEVAGDADIEHEIALPLAITEADESPGEGSEPDLSSSMDSPTQRDDLEIPEVETVCSCYSSAVSLLDQAIELRGRFSTEAAYKAHDAAGEEMQLLMGDWNKLQRQCLSRFGTKLFEESACNKPTEISRKRQALNDSGIRS